MAKTRSNAKSKIAILGVGGRLGAALLRAYSPSYEVTGFTHADLDLADLEKLRSTFSSLRFDVLINAAALTNVDYCENHRDEALHLNAEAPRVLAEICRKQNARFIHISTDYVFDGEKHTPYLEEDPAEPISIYGESKREGERRVAEANERALIARVSWVFGPDRPSFIDAILKKAREEETVVAVADKLSTPTYTHDIASLLQPFLEKESQGNGLLHLANRGECSWQEYAQWALDCCHREGVKMKARTVGATSLGAMTHFIARRPIYTVLATEKYERITNQAPRDWHGAVAEYIREYYGPQA
jgi:dTDP-4-dehydrorhamnose reductase